MYHIDFSSKKTKVLLIGGVFLIVLGISLHALVVRHVIKFPNYKSFQEKRPLAPEDIQGWMTFEYINFVFKLPPEYLKQTFSIEGSQYPKTTLKRYANKAGLDATTFVRNVEEAVKNYKP